MLQKKKKEVLIKRRRRGDNSQSLPVRTILVECQFTDVSQLGECVLLLSVCVPYLNRLAQNIKKTTSLRFGKQGLVFPLLIIRVTR